MSEDVEEMTNATAVRPPMPAGRGETLRDRFDLLSPVDLSALVGVDARTLAMWRAQKRGPDYVKLGRSVFYRRPDVEKWIDLNVSMTDRAA